MPVRPQSHVSSLIVTTGELAHLGERLNGIQEATRAELVFSTGTGSWLKSSNL